MKRWPGAGMSMIIAMPGRWCVTSIIPALGLVLDSFHSLARGIPSRSIGDIRAEKLFIVQVADAPLLDMDLPELEPPFPLHAGAG